MHIFGLLKGLVLGISTSFLVFISTILLFIYNVVLSPFKRVSKSIYSPNTILITGANSGIGKSLAEQYAKPGKTLILLGRDVTRLTEVKAICEKKGATVVTKSLDVTEKEALSEFIVSVDQKYKIDLVIANAGVSAATLGADHRDIQNYINKLFDINVYGVFNTIMPLIPIFKARQEGQIALVSSLSCYLSTKAAYASSKAAITHLGLCLRSDLSSYNIKVNVIAPPYVKTPMTDKNNYHMPLMMSSDEFAAFTMNALARDEPVIAPMLPYFGTWLLHILPPVLSAILSEKPVRKSVEKRD